MHVAVTIALLTVASPADRTISFAKEKWQSAAWTSLRLPEQKTAKAYTQEADCVSVAFSLEDRKQHGDNAPLMTDTKLADGQFEVTFTIGPEKGTAPGIFVSPVVKDGVLQKAVAIFVANYTLAAWLAEIDPESGKMKYTSLVRLIRWSEPGPKHVVRCRYTKRGRIALQLDDSDVVVIQLADYPMNTRIGIWGCHGTCKYYSLKITGKGTLPWRAVDPVSEK